MSARVLWRPWTHPEGAAAFVGVEFLLPTASNPALGTEKYSVAPLAALFLPLRSNVFFIGIYQQLISFAGRDSRADLNILRIRPVLLAQWAGGWWALLDVGFLWDLEDDRPSDDTMTLGIELGGSSSRSGSRCRGSRRPRCTGVRTSRGRSSCRSPTASIEWSLLGDEATAAQILVGSLHDAFDHVVDRGTRASSHAQKASPQEASGRTRPGAVGPSQVPVRRP